MKQKQAGGAERGCNLEGMSVHSRVAFGPCSFSAGGPKSGPESGMQRVGVPETEHTCADEAMRSHARVDMCEGRVLVVRGDVGGSDRGCEDVGRVEVRNRVDGIRPPGSTRS